MALSPLTGPVYDLQIVGGRRARGADAQGKARIAKFQYTAVTTATGIASLGKLPPGRIRVLSYASFVSMVTAADAACVLDIGYAAYTNMAGTVVLADAAAFANDVATPTTVPTGLTLPAVGYTDFETENGLTITLTVSGGNITATEVVELFMTFIELDA